MNCYEMLMNELMYYFKLDVYSQTYLSIWHIFAMATRIVFMLIVLLTFQCYFQLVIVMTISSLNVYLT